MKGTIYKIQSKINNKIYIGMTTRDVTVRWYEHRADYKNLGLTYKELSDKYGMSISHIHRIITYKIYKSIK